MTKNRNNSRTSDAARFFDGFANTFDTLYDRQRGPVMRWFDSQFRHDIEIRYRLTFERLGNLNGHSVIDIGCGSGPYLISAIRQGADSVTGLDPATGMLELTKRRVAEAGYADRVNLIEGSFPETEVELHDYAIVMGVLDYVDDAFEFLSELRKVISQGAAVSFPSRHWFRTPIRRFRYRLRGVPVYFYDKKEIRQLCEGAGFGSISIHKIPGAGQDFHVWVTP